MKRTLLACLLFASCQPNRNEVMASLLNRQKSLKDSIELAKNYEAYWYDSASKVAHGGYDSIKVKTLVDSSGRYFATGLRCKRQLESVEFSIDSLSKMK